MAWIDGHCSFRDAELLKHMASGDFDSDYSILARQYRMALWTLYRWDHHLRPFMVNNSFRIVSFRREHEIVEIDEKMESFEFEPEDEVFADMLYDIVQPERIVIDKCIPIFEKLALENERKSSNEPTWLNQS